jgi:ABC-type sugar transport system ATPase subunit
MDMPMKEELIVIEGGQIEKNGNRIFSDLNLQIYKNQILGIIFDSIVERKYLQEFFEGDLLLSKGKIYLEGNKADTVEAEHYLKNNLTIIRKESKLISNLHIEENVYVFADKKKLIYRRKYLREIQGLLKQFHLDFNLNKQISELTIKEKVVVELLKAYAENKKIVILTHITGFLKRNELDEIFTLIKQMQQRISFILVEQFESIIFEWTDQIAVIRHGKTAGIYHPQTVNRELLYAALIKENKAKKMVGMDKMDLDEEKENEPVFQFEQVNTSILTNFSMEIETGEVVKIYYMDDESCEHIIELLKGTRKSSSGRLILMGQEYRVNNIVQAVKQGVCFIEESPYDNMLLYNMSLRDNLSLSLFQKIPLFWMRKRIINSVDQLVKTFPIESMAKVKLRKLEPHILQQIAYYKWYLYAPKVVVCIKPFTETDIHLQEITVEMISMLKRRGISVIILTSNYSELYRVDGDTICIKNGRIIDEDEVYQTLYKE